MQQNETLELVCPWCQGLLREAAAREVVCTSCGMGFGETLGIRDLRYPRVDTVADQQAAAVDRLVQAYPTSSYLDLVDVFFSSRDLSALPEHIASSRRQRRESQLARASRFTDMLLSRFEECFSLPSRSVALALGCGAGAGLVRLAQIYDIVVGVDPSLTHLILAGKFCEENDLENVTLVQAYGQHLPFRSECLDYVTAQNVLEHVLDVDVVVCEVARVLSIGGGFSADSRNRYDLFFPEPHVGIRWVGWLPRAWASRYVQWRTGIENYDDHIRLLSHRELGNALIGAFGDSWEIVFPKVHAYGMPRRADLLLREVESIDWLRQVLLLIFPSHLALASKKT